MTALFRVVTTPSFDRDFRRTAKGNPTLENALHALAVVLAQDPYNRSTSIPSRNSQTSNPMGNGESDGMSIVCDMTYMGAKWCSILFGTGRKLTSSVSLTCSRVRSRDSRGRLSLHEHSYFPASSRFTASLTTFPSTLMPAPEKRAMAFFMTVPMSFMVGEPISAMVAFTPATISASAAALGR